MVAKAKKKPQIDPKKDPALHVRNVCSDVFRAFRVECAEKDLTIREATIQLLERVVSGEIELNRE